jgi:hypothetical protein
MGAPLQVFDKLQASGETRIAALSVGGRHGRVAGALIGAGLLAPDGVIGATVCDACEGLHLADIVFDETLGRYGWHCPKLGFVEVDNDSVSALSLGMRPTAVALAMAFSRHYGEMRWTTRLLDVDDVCLVGVWAIEGTWTTVVLARRIELTSVARETYRRIAELPTNDAGLVLTVGAGLGFEAPPRFRTLPLTTAVLLSATGSLSIDIPLVARTLVFIKGGRSLAGRPPVEQQVFLVLENMKARGQLKDHGLAPAVRRTWHVYHPGSPCPQASTLRKHVRRWLSEPNQRGSENDASALAPDGRARNGSERPKADLLQVCLR